MRCDATRRDDSQASTTKGRAWDESTRWVFSSITPRHMDQMRRFSVPVCSILSEELLGSKSGFGCVSSADGPSSDKSSLMFLRVKLFLHSMCCYLGRATCAKHYSSLLSACTQTVENNCSLSRYYFFVIQIRQSGTSIGTQWTAR